MGRHQLRLLQFAIRYPGWHSYGTDPITVRVVRSLESLGLIETNEFRQFRLTPPAYGNNEGPDR